MNWSEMESTGVMLGCLISFVVSFFIVITIKWHGKFTLDGTSGVQKFHMVPTPRIGGVGVMLGLFGACACAPGKVSALLWPILIAGLPAFCFGLAEDVTKRVSVRTRLLATMASGMLAWFLTGGKVDHVGIHVIDDALAVTPVAVLFTAFAVGGVANSVNIIDGFNGLASGTMMICLGSLGLIAQSVGDTSLALLCFSVCAVTLGFFLVNFPFGKLFLGDGGAYLLGYLLAWLAVMLVHRNPSVSPWAALMACAYPIFETIFTIVRRIWARAHPGQPDSHHLHSMVKVGIALRVFPHLRADLRNASVSPVSWLVAAVPSAFAVRFPENTLALLLALLFSASLYLAVYWYASTASGKRLRASGKLVTLPELDTEDDFPVRRVS